MKLDDIFDNIDQNKSTDKDDRILIIDGTNSYLRIFSSVPIISETGDHVGGIVGFLRSIASNIRDFNPTRCIIVFDGKGGSLRRRSIYPEYKRNRTGKYNLRRDGMLSKEEEEVSMRNQLRRVHQYLELLPVQVICQDYIEADDVISYLSTRHFKNSKKIRIVSTDKDFLQLLNDRIEVYSPVKKKLYHPEILKEEFNLHPNNYLLYRMVGKDNSDNIKGIKGIELKTLLKAFPRLSDTELTFEDLINESKQIVENQKKPKQIYKSLVEGQEILERNYKLMQLQKTDISIESKDKIKNTVNQPIPKLNSIRFKAYLMQDKIMEFKNLDNWLLTSFNNLYGWAIH